MFNDKKKDNHRLQLIEKWANHTVETTDQFGKKVSYRDPLAIHEIKDPVKQYVTVQLLENQAQALNEADGVNQTPQIQNYDPVLIKMVRRITPQLIAYDIVGVQPLTMPTGLAFAIKARYVDSAKTNFKDGEEALFDKVDTAYSGTGTHDTSENPFLEATDVLAKTGNGMDTHTGETSAWKEMGFSIEKVSVEAKTRQLRADYSIEVEKDLQAVHGLDASTELSNILTDEIVLETNQELIRKLYAIAIPGAKNASTAGTFDVIADADGRWAGERALGLWTFIEKEANKIALSTRRGRGNFIITSMDVATTLQFAGILKNDTNYQQNLDIDIIGSSYAGTAGKFKVFVDPLLLHDGVLIGYKGFNEYDAGLIYCPYVPLSAHSAQDPRNFNRALGFKTRYGLVANPYTVMEKNKNVYYRKFAVSGLNK